MNFANKEKWKKEYQLGQTEECPFCGGENLEHSCRNCYSKIDKETCSECEGYCQKCFTYVNKEIPKLEVLKQSLGVNCKCNDPECGKCLIINCEDDNCPVHTMDKKIDRRQSKNLN